MKRTASRKLFEHLLDLWEAILATDFNILLKGNSTDVRREVYELDGRDFCPGRAVVLRVPSFELSRALTVTALQLRASRGPKLHWGPDV